MLPPALLLLSLAPLTTKAVKLTNQLFLHLPIPMCRDSDLCSDLVLPLLPVTLLPAGPAARDTAGEQGQLFAWAERLLDRSGRAGVLTAPQGRAAGPGLRAARGLRGGGGGDPGGPRGPRPPLPAHHAPLPGGGDGAWAHQAPRRPGGGGEGCWAVRHPPPLPRPAGCPRQAAGGHGGGGAGPGGALSCMSSYLLDMYQRM
jgi:hypothetical protein